MLRKIAVRMKLVRSNDDIIDDVIDDAADTEFLVVWCSSSEKKKMNFINLNKNTNILKGKN